MNIPDNLPIASAFMIVTIGWFSISIANMNKKLSVKILYALLLATAVFCVFSLIVKNIAIPLYFMMMVMSIFQMFVKHFLDHHGETYGQMDVLAEFKKIIKRIKNGTP